MTLSIACRSLCLAAIIATAGCTYAPYDGQIIAHSTDAVSFKGCATSPNVPVTLQALPAGPWTNVPGFSARTSASINATDSNGVNWYCWSNLFVVPDPFWGFGPGGSRAYQAFLRVLYNGSPGYTYKNDYSQCPQPYGSAQLTNAVPCALDPDHSGAHGLGAGAIEIYASSLK